MYLYIQIIEHIFVHTDILKLAGKLWQSFIKRCHIHTAAMPIILSNHPSNFALKTSNV